MCPFSQTTTLVKLAVPERVTSELRQRWKNSNPVSHYGIVIDWMVIGQIESRGIFSWAWLLSCTSNKWNKYHMLLKIQHGSTCDTVSVDLAPVLFSSKLDNFFFLFENIKNILLCS